MGLFYKIEPEKTVFKPLIKNYEKHLFFQTLLLSSFIKILNNTI